MLTLLALLVQDGPKIDRLYKPEATFAIVRFSDPKKHETPEIVPGEWLALDAARGWGVVRVDDAVKELQVRSARRLSKPAPVAGAKPVNWVERMTDVSVEAPERGRIVVKNRSRGVVVAVIKKEGKPVAGLVTIAGADGEFDAPRESEIVLVTEDGIGWRGPSPLPRSATEAGIEFDWNPVGAFQLNAVSVTAKAFFLREYRGKVEHRREEGGEVREVDSDEYDMTGFEIELRFDCGPVEFTFGVARGTGEGEGTGIFETGGVATTADADYDIEALRLEFFLGRRLGGLIAPGFRVEVRADLGVVWVREEMENAVIHLATGDLAVDGSNAESELVFAAKLGIELQVNLGKNWMLIALGEGQFDIEKGVVWSAGGGVGVRF